MEIFEKLIEYPLLSIEEEDAFTFLRDWSKKPTPEALLKCTRFFEFYNPERIYNLRNQAVIFLVLASFMVDSFEKYPTHPMIYGAFLKTNAPPINHSFVETIYSKTKAWLTTSIVLTNYDLWLKFIQVEIRLEDLMEIIGDEPLIFVH